MSPTISRGAASSTPITRCLRSGLTTALGALLLIAEVGCGATQQSSSTTAATSSSSTASSSTELTVVGSVAAPSTAGRPPTTKERKAIDTLVRAAGRARALPAKRRVPATIESPDQISEHLSSRVEEEELIEAKRLYSALGMISEDLDLMSMMRRLLAEQVLGYYDPEEGRLVLRDDMARDLERGGGEDGLIVLVHEIVHALQDHHLGLGEKFELERDTDAENAYRSVIEGDAMVATVGFLLNAQGITLEQLTDDPNRLAVLLGSGQPEHGELNAAPMIIQRTLLAPYIEGALFAATLYRHGGWETVNRAHHEPPASTEQILHPQKYLDGEPPEKIALPNLDALDEAGCESVLEDTLGELEIGVYLGRGTDAGLDLRAAAGWAGDRLRLYRCGERDLIVWLTTWDDEDEAIEAEHAAKRGARTKDSSGDAWLKRKGRALLITHGLPTAHRSAVAKTIDRYQQKLPASWPTPRPGR